MRDKCIACGALDRAMGREHGAFRRPRHSEPTQHLLLANCDPSRWQAIEDLFFKWGPVQITLAVGEGKSHCFVTLPDAGAAAAAQAALNGAAAPSVAAAPGGRLVVSFAEKKEEEQDTAATQGVDLLDNPAPPLPSTAQAPSLQPAVRSAQACGIPGLTLYEEFVSPEEEAALLQLAQAQQHWQLLARRRVLHFGFVFDYETRGVGPPLHPLPEALAPLTARIEALPGAVAINQLTVNEYECGVGISPHIETHSAFTGAIASLSLAGPAVMVLRRQREGHTDEQRSLFLPPRSLLVMSGEARYCWQHYIPHRKSDLVQAEADSGVCSDSASASCAVVARGPKRVSFTFRQVRGFPCDCPYPDSCDSQLAPLAPTRLALKRMALETQRQEQGGQQELEQRQQQHIGKQHQERAAAGSCGDGTDAAVSHLHDAAAGAPARTAAGAAAGGTSQAQASCASVQRGAPMHPIDSLADPASSDCHQACCPGAAISPAAANASSGGHVPASASAATSGDSERELAALEARYVHAVYDAIAPHFAATRFAVWPRVRAFLEALPPTALLADVGCGNGKYWGVRHDAYILASDRSEGLARVAARRLLPGSAAAGGERMLADVAMADGLALPYRPRTCDGALCIAVLHHIASPARRVALLAQLLRVLRPGGRALVTVWATQQGNMKKVRSWQPISVLNAGGAAQCGAVAGAGSSEPTTAVAAAGGAARLERAPASLAAAAAVAGAQRQEVAEGEAVASGDYFVPWHLPFHRAETAAAARAVGQGAGSQQQEACQSRPQGQQQQENAASGAPAAGGTPAAPAAPSAPLLPAPAAATAVGGARVDGRKGAVVFQRYYHLFEEGELEGLVAQLPGARVVESFYDRDNWCCVFERREEAATGSSPL